MAEQELKTQTGQAQPTSPTKSRSIPGGGRFNRKLLVIAGAFAVVIGVARREGIRSAGVKGNQGQRADAG